MTFEELEGLNTGNWVVYVNGPDILNTSILNWGYVYGRDSDNRIIMSWSRDLSGLNGFKCYHEANAFIKMGLDHYIFLCDDKAKLALQLKYSDIWNND